MKNILERIKNNKPLVHHITNYVTVNDCANVVLNWGGLPVMADSEEEVADMVKMASAVVLNIGTLNERLVNSMLRAGKRANRLDIPVILDPVGTGSTEYRTNVALKLLEELNISVITGNIGEITILSGNKATVRGVESVGKYDNILVNAKNLAKKYDAIVVVSDSDDIVTDGEKSYKVYNGHPLMKQVVGTGCMLTSTIGVFAGVKNSYLGACLDAVSAFGVAGENAAKESGRPASYKIALLDNISTMSDKILEENQKVILLPK